MNDNLFTRKYLFAYLYVLLGVTLSYALSFFMTLFVSRFFVIQWRIIPAKFIFPVTTFLNLVIIFIIWLILNKRINHIAIRTSKKFYTIGLYVLVISLTILYQIGNGECYIRKINDTFEKWHLFLSIVIFIPIIEELIYREILIKFLYWNNGISVVNIFFISFLFALIHIGLDPINWLYLIYVFLISVLLLLIRFWNGLFACIITHIFINSLTWVMVKNWAYS